VAALRAHVGRPEPALDHALHMVVPLAAGLGGGSSDAAAAVAVAARAWGLALDRPTRLAIGAQIGSDVPFFALGAAAAWATGRGERLAVLPAATGEPACLLAVSAGGVATADVFATLDRIRPADGGATPGGATEATASLAAALRTGLDAAALVARAGELREANDLWAALAALRPDVVRWRDALEAAAGRPWLLSGSGPTLVALYASLPEARVAAERLARHPAGRPDGARLIATPLGAARRRSSESEGAA
ncbi:MAG TPA: hypothetical protein VMH24_01885, partial [Candidatus Sulfotelmatobacter sp.]|nr:hypothetical protein [Candidatus Sulfotelmatobacter sp.]